MKKLFLIPILAISFAHAYDIKPTDEVDEVIRAEKLVKSHPKLQNKDIHMTYYLVYYIINFNQVKMEKKTYYHPIGEFAKLVGIQPYEIGI